MIPTQYNYKIMASLPELQGVLDPADRLGAKNRLIDEIHRRSLAQALAAVGSTRYATVVDFGCGVGRLSEHLLRYGDRVFGFDPESAMVARAQARARSRRSGDERLAFYARLSDLPELTGPVLVVCAYVLEQVSDASLVESMSDLTSLIGPGATLVVIERVTRVSEGPILEGELRSIESYSRVLADSGWAVEGQRFVRRADSVVQQLNVRAGRLRRGPLPRPLVGRLANLEIAAAAKPNACEYNDMVLWGRSVEQPSRKNAVAS